MTWANNLKRIRRMLRDPDAKIWGSDFLRGQFNDAQNSLQIKTNFLDEVQTVRVPPKYDFAYLQDWEWPFLSSTTGNYQALRFHQQGEIVFCYRWEAQAFWGLVDATAPDEGIHGTQPFEFFMGEVPGDIVPIQYPYGFHNLKYAAWDRKPLDPMTKKEIQLNDPSWMSRTGIPFGYFRPDELENQFCLYPTPSTVVWDTEILIIPDPLYVYTFSWEYSGVYISGAATAWNREDTTNLRQYIFDWELDLGVGIDQAVMRGMWQFEQEQVITSFGIGMVLYGVGDTVTSEFGTIADMQDLINGGEYGIVTDVIDIDNNVLLIYSVVPEDMVDETSESPFPDFMQKYVEYQTLRDAYAADTDGQIESLRNYWQTRADVGLKAIQRFMSKRNDDRDYRLRTKGVPGFRTRRDPRLPDHYPAVLR